MIKESEGISRNINLVHYVQLLTNTVQYSNQDPNKKIGIFSTHLSEH